MIERSLSAQIVDVQIRHGWRMLSFLSLLMGFASISTDVYLPAMPAIGQALNVGMGEVEWTVSGFLAGLALGQLVWGPIGDRYGRRWPIAAGLALFTIGSAACALAGGIHSLIAARLVQAVGASASVVLARAIVRDLYEGPAAARAMSTLMMVMTVGPLLGPLVGGQVLAVAGWRAIFWLLVVVGIATLAALPVLGETLPSRCPDQRSFTGSFAGYAVILSNRRLWAYVGAGSFFYAGMFAYIAGSPYTYIVVHHFQPQTYGLLFATGVAGIMGANLLNARIVHRVGSDRLLVLGGTIAACSGLVLAVNVLIGWGGLVGLVASLSLFSSAAGLVVANSIVGALAVSPAKAGSVSAVVGAAQYGAGILGSGAVGAFANGTAQPMAFVIAVCGLGTFTCALLIERRQ